MTQVVSFRNVVKCYTRGTQRVQVLNGLNLGDRAG